MIITDCIECKENTFIVVGDTIGCINQECKNVEWYLVGSYFDDLQYAISLRLGFCGCGDPDGCILFIKEFLELKQLRSAEIIDWHEYEKRRIELFLANPEILMWIIEYLLDDKKITTHGGNASGSWVDDRKFMDLIDRFCDQHKKRNLD